MEYRRRIDRILAPDYLGDLEERSTDEIRQMRDECEEEESGVSYARRVVQGKLDILRAEVLRRRDASDDETESRSLLDSLPRILGDDVAAQPLRQRVTRHLVPPHVQYHRREVDNIADEQALNALSEKSAEELTALAEDFAAKEQEFSARRRELLDRIDALQDELARRYKKGETNVGEVLRRQG